MPPHHHSPLEDQSFASMADQLAQLVAITIANNNRIDAIIAKLTEITEIPTTTLIKNTNMGDITSRPFPPTSPSQPLLLTTPTYPPLTLSATPPSPIQSKIQPPSPPSPKEPLPQEPLTTTYEHIRHVKLFFRLLDQCFLTLLTLNDCLLDLED
ncbi:unnamed protein product [Lactuca virosa]|uniref:Uncharacterized protein n=1 Tax=Lactuca virosa TaxID=75947 RepID=A0AAU9MUE4_9ASTR|nr:unnamed protein product [Lactuca virosa]